MRIDEIMSLAERGDAGIDIVAKEKLVGLFGAGLFDGLFDLMPTIVPGSSPGGDSATPDPTDGPCPPNPPGQPTLPHNWNFFTDPAATIFGSGTVNFAGFTPTQVQNSFALIPEEGARNYQPMENGQYYGVDGFYLNPFIFAGGPLATVSTDYWYKIPDGASVTVSPASDGSLIITDDTFGASATPLWQLSAPSSGEAHDAAGNPFSNGTSGSMPQVYACCGTSN